MFLIYTAKLIIIILIIFKLLLFNKRLMQIGKQLRFVLVDWNNNSYTVQYP
jgi:hypothetical protein